MITLHYDGLGINATSGPLTGFRVAHVKSECHGFTEQERNELGRVMVAAPELLAELRRLEEVFQSMARSAEKYGLPGTFAEGCELNEKSIRAAIARATNP